MVIGDGVKAHSVTVSVDGGALTVAGTIDASGAAPGTIRLSAGNGLALASTAVLDAHGTVLQTDSYGQPIEAKNRGHIELTAAGGALTLSPGATMNLTAPNGVAYGDVVLNAQRTGETSGDIAINAAGPLNIKGAYSIALNAFWTYNLPDGSTITQATLDGYDVASTTFISAALGNTGLSARVAGLSAYGSAYHLRPGVTIASDGALSTKGDLDLSGYRYGPNADPAVRGSGEPGVLVVRAASDLKINGSINDGFAPPPASPDAVTVIATGTLTSPYTVTTDGVVIGSGSTIPTSATVNMELNLADGTVKLSPSAAHPLPATVTLAEDYTVRGPNVQTRKLNGGHIITPDRTYNPGDTLLTNTEFPAGTVFEKGVYFTGPAFINTFNSLVLQPLRLPAGASLYVFGGYTFAADTPLPKGTVLPITGNKAGNVTEVIWRGDRVWVSSPYVADIGATPTPSAQDLPAEIGTRYATVALNVRTSPSTSSSAAAPNTARPPTSQLVRSPVERKNTGITCSTQVSGCSQVAEPSRSPRRCTSPAKRSSCQKWRSAAVAVTSIALSVPL